MRRSNELELRLIGWADEYSGGSYENLGYPSRSWLHGAMIYHGPSPQGLNPRRIEIDGPADEVEQAVRFLERQKDGYRPGRVLRAEYWMRSAAEYHKLQALRHAGLSMSRAGYYQYLRTARTHVAGWLRVPINADHEDIACV